MLFNSYIFILLFMPVTLTGWYMLNKLKYEWVSKVFLLGMSLWFYGYFNFNYLFIIIASILINYLLFKLMKRNNSSSFRKAVMVFGICLNIGILLYYKYLDFFISNINAVFKTDFTFLNLVLPLGISFFTFQQVSFVIDSYRGDVPDYSLLDYALFVCFFPQLIAGPIVLHDEIVPQFADKNNKSFSYENFARGIYAFSLGLAKKVLIADVLGNFANVGFADIPNLNSTSAIVSMLSYTLQIYFDFSGYCDMATGIGCMFNITFPQNFNSPYKALDMDDFWKRWHMTLTRFLTKNLYYPLGGNRKGKLRTYLNQFIVFIVSGMWHGANWTFILWGALNGIAVIISKLLNGKVKKAKEKAPFIFWLITFICINLLWVYFRADSISLGSQMISKIFAFDFGRIPDSMVNTVVGSEMAFLSKLLSFVIPGTGSAFAPALLIVLIGFAVYASTKMKNTNEKLLTFKPDFKTFVFTFVIFAWSLISLSGVSTFLYFNF